MGIQIKTESINIIINTMEPDKKIKVIDKGIGKEILIYLSTSQKLSEVRKEIAQNPEWKSNEFFFLNDKEEISLSSEKKIKVSEIIHKGELKIKTCSKKKEKSDDEAIKKEYNKAMDTKKKIEEILDEVDKFQKKYKKQSKEQIKEKQKDLNAIEDKLNSIQIKAKFELSVKPQELIQNLKKIKKDNSQYLDSLKKANNISTRELLQGFYSTICVGFCNGEQVKQNVVNFDKIQYHKDNQAVGLSKNQWEFSQSKSFDSFKTSFNERVTGGSINMVAVTPIAIVKAGAQYYDTSNEKKAKKENQKSKFFKNFFYAAYVGKGVNIDQNSITVKKQIIEEYTELLEQFGKKKQTKNFKEKIVEFIKKYGWEIQYGTYLMGNTYKLQNQLNFSAEQSYSTRLQSSSKDLKLALAGGGFIGGGLVGGKASFNHKSDKAQKEEKAEKNVSYQSSRNFESNPAINNYQDWKKIVTLHKGSWKVISKQTKRVELFKLIKNKVNRNKTISAYYENQILDCFETLISDIYEIEILNNEKKKHKVNNKNQLHIAIVGQANTGKTYFANQLYGDSVTGPFGQHNPEKQTVVKISKGNYHFYDTPAIFDENIKFREGEYERKIIDLVNRNSKVSSQAYKSINGFLIVAKGGEKIHIKEPIRRMQEMFGDEIFRSTIFVFNFASRDDIKKYKEKILESDILKEIKKIQPDFSFKNQTFFNYKFDEKKLNDQFMEYKDSERSDLLKRIKSLTPYESDTYLKYIERIEQIRTKEAKQAKEKEQKQKNEQQQKQHTQKFFQRLRYFHLKDKSQGTYVKFGIMGSGFLGIGERGFTMGKSSKRLFLDNLSMDYEKGIITGSLGDENKPNYRASTNENNYVGYRIIGTHNIQKVKIIFEKGKKGLINFSNRQNENVRIDLRGYFKDLKGQLRRVPEKESHTFSFRHC